MSQQIDMGFLVEADRRILQALEKHRSKLRQRIGHAKHRLETERISTGERVVEQTELAILKRREHAFHIVIDHLNGL